MDIEGKIAVVMPAKTGVSQKTGKSWAIQDYVIDYFWWPNQQNASKMVYRVLGEERIKNFNLKVNDEVRITFHVEAHEYDGRWYNEIHCTACKKVGASAKQAAQQSVAADAPSLTAPATAEEAAGGEADELPF